MSSNCLPVINRLCRYPPSLLFNYTLSLWKNALKIAIESGKFRITVLPRVCLANHTPFASKIVFSPSLFFDHLTDILVAISFGVFLQQPEGFLRIRTDCDMGSHDLRVCKRAGADVASDGFV